MSLAHPFMPLMIFRMLGRMRERKLMHWSMLEKPLLFTARVALAAQAWSQRKFYWSAAFRLMRLSHVFARFASMHYRFLRIRKISPGSHNKPLFNDVNKGLDYEKNQSRY